MNKKELNNIIEDYCIENVTALSGSAVNVMVQDFSGNVSTHKITIKDVLHYYAYQANNLSSGCRKLGDIVGDWRYIDRIARNLLEIFKIANLNKVRSLCNKHFSHIMKPNF